MEVVTRNDHSAYSPQGARVHSMRGEESGGHAHNLDLIIPTSSTARSAQRRGKVNSHAGHMKLCDPNDRRWESGHA
jgi:hypothetical protein